jgi:hypothetical protein
MDLSLLLHQRFGFSQFRPAQQQLIERVLAGESALAVMPTGSGKPLCYQLPSLFLPGLTLVVSPLIALMKDQLDRLGLPATVINSTVPRELQAHPPQARCRGQIKILYIAPERLQSDEFRKAVANARTTRKSGAAAATGNPPVPCCCSVTPTNGFPSFSLIPIIRRLNSSSTPLSGFAAYGCRWLSARRGKSWPKPATRGFTPRLESCSVRGISRGCRPATAEGYDCCARKTLVFSN